MVWVILIILELCTIYIFSLLLRKEKETPWHTFLEMYDWICSYFGGQGVYVWFEKEFGLERLCACAELPLILLCPHRQWHKIISRQKDDGRLLINNDHNVSVCLVQKSKLLMGHSGLDRGGMLPPRNTSASLACYYKKPGPALLQKKNNMPPVTKEAVIATHTAFDSWLGYFC